MSHGGFAGVEKVVVRQMSVGELSRGLIGARSRGGGDHRDGRGDCRAGARPRAFASRRSGFRFVEEDPAGMGGSGAGTGRTRVRKAARRPSGGTEGD